jgi:polysaccharide chain length determinant protein (PEP-CTERM system associated)
MWQWRWIGLLVAWVVGIVAAVVVARMPNQYEASARIYVDTQSVLKPLMSGLAIQPNVDQQISILSRTLISRPNVEKLSRMADLDHGVKSKEEHDRLVDRLMKTLMISRAGGDNLYTLSYRDGQPEKAMRVVQSLTSIFVESSLGTKRKDTDSAKQFIDEQIRIYEKKLTDAENRLKEFKLRHFNVTGEGRDAFSRMGQLNAALSQARLELREAENSRDALKRQVAGEEPVLLAEPSNPAGNSSLVAVPELDGRIEAVKRNLDGLLQRYTEQHPDVLGARRILKDLEEQKRQEIAARKKLMSSQPATASYSGPNTNPVYQQLKVSLAEAEAHVASLRTRVAEYETRYAQFKSSIQVMPEIETEFAQLNRDYDVHRSNYQTLVSRREAAVISSEMDASSANAEFRLIDPPRVTPQPVAPNRLLLFTLAFLGALAAGVFASFAASQIRPSFFDAHALREVTGVPVLGTVSLIVSEPLKRKERRGLIGFIAGTVALIGSYGAGIFVLLMLSARTV